jgi:hypothetical protein
MSGTLIAHRGAVRIPKEALMQIEAPTPTQTWRPVSHGVLVNTLTEVLSSRGIAVKKEEYAVQREGNLLFGVMDLVWGGTLDYYAALGIRTSNDKTFAIQIAIGARVIVCDNLLMSGELIALKRKHTAGLELVDELTAGIRRYELGYQQLTKGIEQLKVCSISLVEAREMVFTIFARRILPVRLFPDVSRDYLKDSRECSGITAWDVQNSCTSALKKLTPTVAFAANVKLGKFFSRPPVIFSASQTSENVVQGSEGT